MGLRQVDGKLRRKGGMQYWVVACPYCNKNHWCKIGPYTIDATAGLHRFVKLPCGSNVEIRRPKKGGGQ